MKTSLFCTLAALCALVSAKEPIDYIDPLIGTEGKGSQYGGMMPMTGVPFGSIQWVPMTRLTEVGSLSYNEIDTQLLGFLGTRQPAIWMGDWGQVSFMPRTGAVDCDFATRGTPFDHAREQVAPWRTRIESGGIVTDYAGTSRAAVYRIRFPKGVANPHVVVDASRDYVGRPTDKTPADGFISIGADGSTITGWNADRLDAHHAYPLPNFRGWFVMEFSRPFQTWGCYTGVPRGKGYQGVKQIPNQRTAQANRVGGWVAFAPDCEELVVKVGVSLISAELARANLRREITEDGAAAVDAVAARSRAAWSAQFARLTIETPREDVKTIFYTGLYHALLYPREIDEYGRYYSAFDDRVHEGRMYNCYSLWDTYRAEHPLLTFVAPERVDGMMQALVEMYREGGWLPKWPNPSYTGIMIGAPAEMVLAEAWTKGFRGFDVKAAYEAVKKNATVPQPTDDQFRWEDRGLFGRTPETRGGLASYMKRGWVSCDRTTESVSRTQDFSLNDTAAAILAEAAGDASGAALFRARSHSWTNVWNAERGYFFPRKADGSWADPASGHHYCECSPETALWCVPHDVDALVRLMGGAAAFERRLDGFFDTLFWKPERGNKSIHGNEPSHHVAYLYNRVGAYDKTARRVRDILTRSYSTDRKGFDGNEDCGQMSAWYILSALGIYPLNPADGWYEIGSPLVDRATIRLGAPYKPATLFLVVRNQALENWRVKSVSFNGKTLADRRIHHNDLVRGGELVFEMDGGDCTCRLTGAEGRKAATLMEERVFGAAAKGPIYEETVNAFRTHKDDSGIWQGEYWGKTMLSAAVVAEWTGNEAHKAWLRDQARAFVKEFQQPDGYLCTYTDRRFVGGPKPDAEKRKGWDREVFCWNLWGRKYTMWALIEIARVADAPDLLVAAARMMDQEIRQLKESGVRIENTGFFVGLPSMSVLKPLMVLGRATKNEEYLKFAQEIVAAWDRAGNPKPNLVANAFSDKPVYQWYPDPGWWAKAYEMMSCMEGLVDFACDRKDARVLDAVRRLTAKIAKDEMNAVGGVGYFDHFTHAAACVNATTEPCDVVHWMRVNRALFLATDDPHYLDDLETAFFNAFLAGTYRDGKWGAHSVRSHGTRHRTAPHQVGMKFHQCCIDNMPRGFVDVAQTVVTRAPDGAVSLNLCLDAETRIPEGAISVSGGYPYADRACVRVTATRKCRLRIRVPPAPDSLLVDGRAAEGRWFFVDEAPGERTFDLQFRRSPRIVRNPSARAEDRREGQFEVVKENPEMKGRARQKAGTRILYGPLILAKGRYAGTSDEEIFRDRVADGEWKAAIRPVPPRKTTGAWLLTLTRGTEQVEIPVSDFASVADVDDADNLFSIWF